MKIIDEQFLRDVITRSAMAESGTLPGEDLCAMAELALEGLRARMPVSDEFEAALDEQKKGYLSECCCRNYTKDFDDGARWGRSFGQREQIALEATAALNACAVELREARAECERLRTKMAEDLRKKMSNTSGYELGRRGIEVTENALHKCMSERDALRAEVERLRVAYDERGAAMRETGDMVRSLYIPKVEALTKEVAELKAELKAAHEREKFYVNRYDLLEAELKRQGEPEKCEPCVLCSRNDCNCCCENGFMGVPHDCMKKTESAEGVREIFAEEDRARDALELEALISRERLKRADIDAYHAALAGGEIMRQRDAFEEERDALAPLLLECVTALRWIAGELDEERDYCTYYERTLEDGTVIPPTNEIAEAALAKVRAAVSPGLPDALPKR